MKKPTSKQTRLFEAKMFPRNHGTTGQIDWVSQGKSIVGLSEQEKESWLEESSTMHDWVGWCKSKKGTEEIRSYELIGKEIFTNYDETKSKLEKKRTKRTGAKRRHIAGRVYDTGRGGSKATSKWQ